MRLGTGDIEVVSKEFSLGGNDLCRSLGEARWQRGAVAANHGTAFSPFVASAAASPSDFMTASWSATRTLMCFWFSRVGYTRLLSKTTKTRRSGSIQMEVPVKPVWPNECGLKKWPLLPPSVGAAQPSVRVPFESCWGVVNSAMVERRRTR